MTGEQTKAQHFAEALTALCKQHGMMIWNTTVTAPIMASEVTDDEVFHYEAKIPEFPAFGSMIIHRVLGEAC